ncbi:hypothetical protein [Haladaptatus halobius]|uniref:hypothetical protein n=1 Tax=Haladaptatus halobius TaxID=2884875 RepID=UPI001D0B7E02|nr:hypothetical protein [Haladaptatus halobius]
MVIDDAVNRDGVVTRRRESRRGRNSRGVSHHGFARLPLSESFGRFDGEVKPLPDVRLVHEFDLQFVDGGRVIAEARTPGEQHDRDATPDQEAATGGGHFSIE